MANKKDKFSNQMENDNNGLTVKEINDTLAKINPANVDTADKARDIIELARKVSDKMQLFGYKAISKVYNMDLWKTAYYYDEKGVKKGYATFIEWAEKACNLKKSAAYNAVAIGHLITNDGSKSTLYREEWGENDFDFTSLVTIYNGKYTTEEIFEEVKGHKLKKTGRKVWKSCEGWRKMIDGDGAEVLRKVDGHICNVYMQVDEIMSYVDLLIEFEVISPLMTIATLKKALSYDYDFTEYGAKVKDDKELSEDETTDDTTDETTDDTTDETTDDTTDETFADSNFKSSAAEVLFAIDNYICRDNYEEAYNTAKELCNALRSKLYNK